MTFKQIILFIPLAVFLILAYFMKQGLHLDPHYLSSPLINRKAPPFELPTIHSPKPIFNQKAFLGQVSLLNVFASWCEACRIEHPVLMDIAKLRFVKIYGLNYKDTQQAATNFLQQYGNPYSLIGFDTNGAVAIDWGVYGTPESFIVDKKGIVRYKHIGPIDQQSWNQEILPLILKLNTESR